MNTNFKSRLASLIESHTSKEGKIFDYFIQSLIIVSLISFSLETLPNLDSSVSIVLTYVEIFCVVIFSFEYISRIYVSKLPFKYIFSFFGIIDLLAILPFYIAMGIDLRSLRIFRVFRLFRTLKLVRYNKALSRFSLAMKIAKEELILFLIATLIMLYLVSAGIYLFENDAQPEMFSSIFHSLWWASVTLTTVGYGDVYPITVGGKIFTFFVLLIGVGIVTIPAGLVATALAKARKLEDEENYKATK
jgi:voltage-gated potassium channel